ncbi:hypothetical protein [Nocardiopsis dassonvillei]|uniref:hypothetical protein n=1 Tax=Nocardiopsis dassonvillei TaxID=2014 RepID=UPI00362C4C85
MNAFSARELDSPSLTHTDPYLDWAPAQHAEGCREKGWQVRTYERDAGRGPCPIGIRAYCPACGVQYELTATTEFSDEHGDVHGPSVIWQPRPYEGHQVKPTKVKGYWLHAWGKRADRFGANADGFEHYHLTASATPPSAPDEVLGTVGWVLSQRNRVRWQACLVESHVTSHRRVWLQATENAPKPHPSPLGAARWIVAALTQAQRGPDSSST